MQVSAAIQSRFEDGIPIVIIIAQSNAKKFAIFICANKL